MMHNNDDRWGARIYLSLVAHEMENVLGRTEPIDP